MSVDVVDTDPLALKRMQEEIYPGRYGQWDDGIFLCEQNTKPEYYDLTILATPPDTHFELATKILRQSHTKALLIEKPLCVPTLKQVLQFRDHLKNQKVKIFIGYNHRLTKNTQLMSRLIMEKVAWGGLLKLEVYIKEHWKGIFAAHPWLNGPQDTYLGDITRGGGATCEHSHGINLFQYISQLTNNGRIIQVMAEADLVRGDGINYDEGTRIRVLTEDGLVVYIEQDVTTDPPKKKACLNFEHAQLEWEIRKALDLDCVSYCEGVDQHVHDIHNTRPEDFLPEINHIYEVLTEKADYETSPIHIRYGIETALVICAIFRSVEKRRAVDICYDAQEPDPVFIEGGACDGL